MCDHGNAKGDMPQGVGLKKLTGQFMAYCSVKGAQKHLGYYDTAELAQLRYRLFKSKIIRKIASEQLDERIKGGLIRHAKITLYRKT